jgi:EmrB/QacA subfamily drug resistance transporter
MTSTTSPTRPVAGDSRRWWALLVIALAQLMVVFDVTIVNVALPSIGQALDLSAGDRHWVITAYTLAFGGLLLVGGRVADRIGLKRAFLIGLVGFAGASAVGGAAVSLPMLVAARAGQGAFGALLAPTVLSLISATFPNPAERGRAFGVFGVVMGAGSGLGLVLGGAVTEYLSWHWVMYVNAPLALLAAAGGLFLIHRADGRAGLRVDAVGAVLGTAGLVALVYGLSLATTHGWTAGPTVGTIGAAALLLLAFVVAESRVREPLLPLRIVADRRRGAAYLSFVLVMVGMFGMFLLVTFYLQTVLDFTALRAGVAFLPFAAAVLVASMVVGQLTARLRPPVLLGTGLLSVIAGLAWLIQLAPDSDYGTGVLPALALIGLGVGTVSPVAANLATTGVTDHETGIASAVFNTAEQVGASVGVAVLNTIAATHTTTSDDAGLVHGYTTATAWAAVLLGAGAVTVLALARKRRATAQPAAPADRTDRVPVAAR